MQCARAATASETAAKTTPTDIKLVLVSVEKDKLPQATLPQATLLKYPD
jgi:hypothetical protein